MPTVLRFPAGARRLVEEALRILKRDCDSGFAPLDEESGEMVVVIVARPDDPLPNAVRAFTQVLSATANP